MCTKKCHDSHEMEEREDGTRRASTHTMRVTGNLLCQVREEAECLRLWLDRNVCNVDEEKRD